MFDSPNPSTRCACPCVKVSERDGTPASGEDMHFAASPRERDIFCVLQALLGTFLAFEALPQDRRAQLYVDYVLWYSRPGCLPQHGDVDNLFAELKRNNSTPIPAR